MKIKSIDIELVSIDKLIPCEKNMNKHTPGQIDRLCDLITYQGFRDPLIVQKGTNRVAAGHGRLEAAKKLGLKEVPVTYQEFENEDQFYAFVVSHNAIAKDSWAALDLGMINAELENLGPIDIDLLGIKNFNVEPLDDYEPSNSEIDLGNFGNDLEHTCPKCGFEFND